MKRQGIDYLCLSVLRMLKQQYTFTSEAMFPANEELPPNHNYARRKVWGKNPPLPHRTR